MSKTFNCPSCTASLEHDGGDHLTVQCPYCSTTVIVPEALRPSAYQKNFEPLLAHANDLNLVIGLINEEKWEEATYLFHQSYGLDEDEAADAVRRLAAGQQMETAHIKIDAQQVARSGRRAGCLFFLILLSTVGGVFYFLSSQLDENPLTQVITDLTNEEGGIDLEALGTLVPAEQIDELIEPTTTNATVLVETGERGINNGQFNDPRGVAVGAGGSIFVSDFDSGRVQRFDEMGTHLATWTFPDDQATLDLEISADGAIYAVQSGDIFRYDSTTGEPLGQVVYTGDIIVSYQSLAISADGQLFAINGPRDTIIHFDANGETVKVIDTAEIPNIEGIDHLALDGLGNLYVAGEAEDLLGDRQDVIFKFAPDGQYASQFGSSGNEPGTFMGIIGGIAVDGRGYIYVSDFQGIQVFDNNGRFLELIPVDGWVPNLTINQAGQLIAVSNQHKLYVFDVSQIGE